MSTDNPHKGKTLDDVRAVLFDTIDKLRNNQLDIDEARTISELSGRLIETAKVEVEFLRVTDGSSSTFIGGAEGTTPQGLPNGAGNGSTTTPEPGRLVHRLR